MNTEEKAKRYDEALERAKNTIEVNQTVPDIVECVESLFPELKESEDEKMWKLIKKYAHYSISDLALKADHITREHLESWLEKQDEQKSANKVGPKFRVGQWIVWHDKFYKVNYNGRGYELVDQNGLCTSLEYVTFDENAHVWDITKDAKKGDILAYNNDAFIYNGKMSPIKSCCGAFCGIGDFHCFVLGETECEWTFTEHVAPATKEQRDTLLKAMADAGYTFDFDKKELKKIGQIAWGKEDDKSLDSVVNDLKQGVIPDSDDINWLKSLKDRIQHQSNWNPSDEQMDALEHFVRIIGESGHASPYDNNTKLLYSLLSDLNKLKG